MSATKRDQLLALVTAKLSKCGSYTEALEYAAADSDFGLMQGDPIATIRFGSSGIKTLPVDQDLVNKIGNNSGEPYAQLAIDEANDCVILSYGDFAVLSGFGETCIINLDGTENNLVAMMSFT